jgi:hypothetical protein
LPRSALRSAGFHDRNLWEDVESDPNSSTLQPISLRAVEYVRVSTEMQQFSIAYQQAASERKK